MNEYRKLVDKSLIGTLLPDQKSPFDIVLADQALVARVDHYSVAMSDCSVALETPYQGLAPRKVGRPKWSADDADDHA